MPPVGWYAGDEYGGVGDLWGDPNSTLNRSVIVEDLDSASPVDSLKEYPFRQVPVLDHGYVKLIESWGCDERVIEAARMSTGKGFQGWGPLCKNGHAFGLGVVLERGQVARCHCGEELTEPGDEKLLGYLWRNMHLTPFEMCGATFEVKAPIFVFREWHRHRTQSYNEMSARYVPLPDESYVPTVERCLLAGGSNRQAQGVRDGIVPAESRVRAWLAALEETYRAAQVAYRAGLDLGIPKELARLPLPVARYSRMRASANLRNWLHFLELRDAPNAQWEIREYAREVGTTLGRLFPRTWRLFRGTEE